MRRDPFDAEAFARDREGLRRELLASRRQTLLDSLVGELRNRRNVQVNAPMIERIDG